MTEHLQTLNAIKLELLKLIHDYNKGNNTPESENMLLAKTLEYNSYGHLCANVVDDRPYCELKKDSRNKYHYNFIWIMR